MKRNAHSEMTLVPQSVPLTPALVVPANSSRFMTAWPDARRQPTGTVELVWDPDAAYVWNRRFDAGLIAHDDSYCTTQVDLDEARNLPTTGYFTSRIATHLDENARVIDIGCGRGEFVEHLRSTGVDAIGYDPVLPRASAHLRNRYWTAADESADLYVMRCVLPHIPDPWQFVKQLGEANPGALLLVEFQTREWILEHSIWYQLSHDHVNVFSISDFAARCEIVDSGTFGNGEWGWVLMRPDTLSPVERTPPPQGLVNGFAALVAERERALAAAAASARPLYLWGAAGKGIVLAHALQERGAPVKGAIDADPMRQGRLMEVSGLWIFSPAQARRDLPPDALIVVCNPNHLADIRARQLVEQALVLSRDLGAAEIDLGGTDLHRAHERNIDLQTVDPTGRDAPARITFRT